MGNMAQLLNGGSLAQNVGGFCIAGAVCGALLSLLHDAVCVGRFERFNAYVPSGVALAIGLYITPNYVLPRIAGALLQFVWRKKDVQSFDKFMIVCASGFVLGEGIFAIVSAAMKALGMP